MLCSAIDFIRAVEGLLKHGDSVWLILSIVDNVLTVYDVRRRNFRFERRCSYTASSVAIDNVSPDFAAAVFGFEDRRRDYRELEINYGKRNAIIISSFLD